MCSLRGLWIVREADRNVLLSKRFTTVEEREKRFWRELLKHQREHGHLDEDDETHYQESQGAFRSMIEEAEVAELKGFVEIPETDDWVTRIPLPPSFGLTVTTAFLPPLPKSDRNYPRPSLWPLVYLARDGLFIFAIPALEDKQSISGSSRDIIDHLCISVTLNWLHDFHSMIYHSFPYLSQMVSPQLAAQMAEAIGSINMFIGMTLPFGSPIESHPTLAMDMLSLGFHTPSCEEKRPSWKPYSLVKSSQSLDVHVQETINAVLYNDPNTVDQWKIWGKVQVTARIEGRPEVQLLLSQSEHIPAKISDLVHSPFAIIEKQNGPSQKFLISPPLEPFTLCNYEVLRVRDLPFQFHYTIKRISATEIMLFAELSIKERYIVDGFRNLQIDMPFGNFGKMNKVVGTPTIGSLVPEYARSVVLWNLPSKPSAKAALNFSVNYTPLDPLQDHSDSEGFDPFLQNNNHFVKIHFEAVEVLASDLKVEAWVLPKAKLQTNYLRSTISGSFVVWHGSGEARVCFVPQSHREDSPVVSSATSSVTYGSASSSMEYH